MAMEFPGNAGRSQSFVEKDIAPHDKHNRSIGDMEMQPLGERSWLNRTFSRMGPGSMRGAIFNFMAGMIGAGVLVFPYICKTIGFGSAILLFIISWMLCIWSFSMLVHGADRENLKDFSLLLNATCGVWAERAFLYSVIIQAFGVTFVFQMINGGLLKEFFQIFNIAGWNDYTLWVIIPTVFFYFPLCLMTNVDSLKYVSLVSIASILFAIAVIVAQGCFLINNKTFGQIVWFKFDYKFFEACGVLFLAFQCQQSFFPIYKELGDGSTKKMVTATNRGSIAALTFYILAAVFGYFSYFDDTQDVILKNKPMNETFGILINISRIGVALKLTVTIPIVFLPMKIACSPILSGTQETMKGCLNLFFTLIFLGIATCCALFIPGIQSALSILGGLTSVLVAFVFPTLIYINPKKGGAWNWKEISSVVVCSILVVLGVLSFLSTLYSFICPNGCNNPR